MEIINVTIICVTKCFLKILSLIVEMRYPKMTNIMVIKPKWPSEKKSLARPIAKWA